MNVNHPFKKKDVCIVTTKKEQIALRVYRESILLLWLFGGIVVFAEAKNDLNYISRNVESWL